MRFYKKITAKKKRKILPSFPFPEIPENVHHPLQPLYKNVKTKIIYFKSNEIIKLLFKKAGVNIQTLLVGNFTSEDKAQFLMLLGSSLKKFMETNEISWKIKQLIKQKCNFFIWEVKKKRKMKKHKKVKMIHRKKKKWTIPLKKTFNTNIF